MKTIQHVSFLAFVFCLPISQPLLAAPAAKLCGPHSGVSDAGYPWGRAEVDVDGDECLDYCRVVGNNQSDAAIWCTVSYGPLKGQTIKSSEHPFDWGYKEGRAWIDINNDGRYDYCRVVGTTNQGESRIACSISLGGGFGTSILSNVTDWGYPYHREYRDCDNDGSIDFCRAVGNTGYTSINCSPLIYSNNSLNIPSTVRCSYPDPNLAAVPAECICDIGSTDAKINGGACGKLDCTVKCTQTYPPNGPNPARSSRCHGGTKHCSVGCSH